MQLFTFGHPCEHQLRRVCIGGTSCPLNGYPDHWCCSFVKGRINFKRDKPCEGPRCRWGFAHPPLASFDAVTVVLQEARACAARMEENYGTGSLHGGPYVITSPNVADVAHCALNFLRVPPARVACRIGGLLGFAAVKATDAKVFTQLLKTVKKPVDDYLIGAFEFIQAAAAAKGTSNKGGATPSARDTALDDLRHDVISIMASALSHGGVLVARPEQLPLQSYYIAALKTATRNKKKHAEALEMAAALYPDATEQLVAPESFTKGAISNAAGTRRSSEGDRTPSATDAKTPDFKPHSLPVTPQKTPGAAAVTTATTSTGVTPDKSGKAGTPSAAGKQAASTPMSTFASSLTSLPPPLTAAEIAPGPPPTAAKPQPKSAALAPVQPLPAPASLLATCHAMGPCELIDWTAFPVGSCDNKLPASASRLFGGLFTLDALDVATMDMPESGTFAADSPTVTPLGVAIRESQQEQSWRRGPFFKGANMCTDAAARLAEINAAAAALRIVDFVLDA